MAKYLPIPKLSPYINNKQYRIFKETHKFFIKNLKKEIKKEHKTVLDVGCGNGQLLYKLRKHFPNLILNGSDREKKFLNVAKKFKGLKTVNFKCLDIYKNKGKFDIVFCTSTFQIFEDFKKPLKKLISLTKKKGILFIDGLFNSYKIDVKIKFRDNSNNEAKGKWRCDFNQHSIQSISDYLANKKISYKFKKIPMNKKIKFNDKIHINNFTFKSAKNYNLITNGTNLIINGKLLIIKK